MEFTTQFELQSQTTRLAEHAYYSTQHPGTHGSVTLSAALFQGTLLRAVAECMSPDHNSVQSLLCTDSHGGLFPLQSPLLRESWLVSFPLVRATEAGIAHHVNLRNQSNWRAELWSVEVASTNAPG